MTDAAWILIGFYAMGAAGFATGASSALGRYRPELPKLSRWVASIICAPFWLFFVVGFVLKFAARTFGDTQ